MRRLRPASLLFLGSLLALLAAAPAAAEDAGAIAGRITDDASGAALVEVRVEIWRPGSPRELVTETFTAADGSYEASGIAPGSYLVTASKAGYRAEYYPDLPLFDNGTLLAVEVRASATTTGIDLALTRGGRILARVITAETGAPPELPADGACLVAVWQVGRWPTGPGLPCAADGTVEIDGLLPGRYYLATVYVSGRATYLYGVGSCNLLLPSRLCSEEGATAIEVRAGEDSGPFLLPVEKEATLSGHLHFAEAPAGPAREVRLRVFDEEGRELAPLQANATGPVTDFQLSGLAPGRFHLIAEGQGVWQSFAWPRVACDRWFCDPLRGEAIAVAPGAVAAGLDFSFAPLGAYTGCVPSDTVLCLDQGRYRVAATWRDFAGARGVAAARQLEDGFGYFYFFSPGNLEVAVKLRNDCRRLDGHHFTFAAAGLTNVAVELEVQDTLTGATGFYSNLLGEIFTPFLDGVSFATCDVEPAASAGGEPAAPPADLWAASDAELLPRESADAACVADPADPSSLCLGGRFRVRASWRDEVLLGDGEGRPITADTGAFTFVDGGGIDLVVKMLDACATPLPGHWFFAAGLTDARVELRIEDLETGGTRLYTSPGGPFAPIFDLGAFPCN